MEVLVSSVIASVVAGGTMMAFIAAARIAKRQSSSSYDEAAGYARRSLEGFHNQVGADSTFFSSQLGAGWVKWCPVVPPGGTESILTQNFRRCIRVTGEDCDGDGIPARVTPTPETDCYAVDIAVCWNNITPTCPCAACP